MTFELLQPEPDALLHSEQLAAYIRHEITTAGGNIAFSRFMELCLYTPGLGYYSAGSTKFGGEGDFVTAPEIGPLFAATLSNAVAPIMQTLGAQARFLEVGGGSGAFAQTMLKRLMAIDALPARYAILEPSADLRERQRQLLQCTLIPPLFEIVEWLDRPFDDDWDGVLFANEVIDALPTPRFCIWQGEIWEETVQLDEHGNFIGGLKPADALLTAAVRHVEQDLEQSFAEGYRSELLPQLPYWIQAISGGMQRGAMLFADYGYPRKEFYLPQRSQGTLRAFYRHRMHEQIYLWPGLQDLTASVDFTALAEAGTGAGFDLAGYSSQANFLLGNGIDTLLTEATERADEAKALKLQQQAKQLLLPSGMGERFQLMGFERDVPLSPAFLAGDLTWRL